MERGGGQLEGGSRESIKAGIEVRMLRKKECKARSVKVICKRRGSTW